MDERMNTNSEERLAAYRAAEWLERLKDAGPQECAEFNRWLRESPRHVREILLATTWDSAMDSMDPDRRIDVEELIANASVNVVPVRSSHSQTVHRKGVPSWPRMAGLGFASAAALGAVLVWSGMLNAILPLDRYSTSVGEQRAIELADGSVLSLNTQSDVRVDLSDDARDIYLDAGQAVFVVIHDATRPFRVHVGGAVVQAIGTKFDVRRRQDRTDVAVIEGQVRIDAETSGATEHKSAARMHESPAPMHERAKLAAGEAASISADGRVSAPVAINVEEIVAWQQRRLVFSSSTLAEIADEFGRYNRAPRIRIEGDELRATRKSGTFDADDPESFLAGLASDNNIEIERQGNEFVVRLRQGPSQSL